MPICRMDKLARRIRPSCCVSCWSAKVIPLWNPGKLGNVRLSSDDLAGCQKLRCGSLVAGTAEVLAADTVQLPGGFNEIVESHLGARYISPFC